MSFSKQDVISGVYYYYTEAEHSDNNETMSDFLNCEIGEDSGFEVDIVDGTYAEIIDVDTGERYEVHASGNGDFSNHKVEFKLID